MSFKTRNRNGGNPETGNFEETLRLMARLAPPAGLEERVQAGLKAAPAWSGARILAWPLGERTEGSWLGSSLVRSAAATVIVAVVIGGSWGVYSSVQSLQPVRAVTVPLHFYSQGGFSSAGAMRTPQTLNGPMVEHHSVAHPATSGPDAAQQAVQPAVRKTSIHPARTAETGKTDTPPVTPQTR